MALLNNLLDKLNVGLHLPKFNYCGPGTRLAKTLARGDKGINELDNFCKEHDISYSKTHGDLIARREADKVLAEIDLGRVFAKDAKFGERLAALGVAGAMKLKRKLGAGLLLSRKQKKSKKAAHKKKGGSLNGRRKRKRGIKRGRRVIPVPPKQGGVLPLVPLFASVGALASGAATVARAINQAKSNKRQLDESVRHNKHMEALAMGKAGKGFRLRPWGYGLRLRPKRIDGCGLKRKKKNTTKKKIFLVGLPSRALTDVELYKYATEVLKVPYFIGVFMRDMLPEDGPRYKESAIINLDQASGRGTHWVAYKKHGRQVLYFNSYGDLKPPPELMTYLQGATDKIEYNTTRYQNGGYICGHLCLEFLKF